MSDNSTKANFIAKTLFILGGIILFIVLVIFIFRMVPIAISGLKQIGSGIKNTFSGEQIKLKTESNTIYNTSPFLLSFLYEQKQEGQFYISYECANGLFFDIQSQEETKRIVCDTPFKLGTNVDSISLIPVLTKTSSFEDTKISIIFKDEKNNTIAQGSKQLTVKNESGKNSSNQTDSNGSLSGSTITTKEISGITTKVSDTSPSTSYSRPTQDLAITYITPINSESIFVMYVYNLGNTSTGQWNFLYTDAENPSQYLISPTQPSLAPGQGISITVRFDTQKNQRQTISIQLDPSNKISESNETNNIANIVLNSDINEEDSYNSNNDADLIITNMLVGRISNNKFIQDEEIDDSKIAAIKFTVKNQGGNPTGSWRFEITDTPYNTNNTYHSKSYNSLKPGQTIDFTIDFDNIDTGKYTIKVKVDSDDDVDEEKENNNTESESLKVTD